MRNLIFLAIFVFMIFGGQVSATGKTFQDHLEGKWQGFCTPQALTNTGKMCNYTFKKGGSGIYECDYYKDLRCSTRDQKTTTSIFQFTINGGDEKTVKVNLIFSNREDVKQEKSRFYITGEVLRVQVYEVFNMPETKKEDLESQGVIPFFEYTRVKK
ncbi:MAG: hypothetical protein ACXWRE_00700 [Pseudobdellovibrionaceae bacterium]